MWGSNGTVCCAGSAVCAVHAATRQLTSAVAVAVAVAWLQMAVAAGADEGRVRSTLAQVVSNGRKWDAPLIKVCGRQSGGAA